MASFSTNAFESPYKGSGNLTREQFYFYEMRTTARLMISGLTDEEIEKSVVSENLFQYPTERTIKRAVSVCLSRLHALDDAELIRAIAALDSNTAKQICLYAMMRQYRLVWDFMITVIGAKYRSFDTSFGKVDLNAFFMRLQEQDDVVASWSDATVAKLRQVLRQVLIENEYLDDARADHLNPVLISPLLENAIRASGQELALPAFNCLN